MDNFHKSEHVFQNSAKSLIISFINGIDQDGTVIIVKCQETMVMLPGNPELPPNILRLCFVLHRIQLNSA